LIASSLVTRNSWCSAGVPGFRIVSLLKSLSFSGFIGWLLASKELVLAAAVAEVLTLPQAALPPSLNPHPAGNIALNLCKMVAVRMYVGWPGREEGFDMIARRVDAGLTNKS